MKRLMSRKRIILLMSILVIVVTLTVGIVGVLNFNECKKSGGTWSYEKKICEHNLKKA